MKKSILTGVTLLFSYAIVSAQPSTAASNKPGTVSAYYILEQLLNEPGIKSKDVKMMIVDFPSLSVSAPHRHPCPTFGYVLEGEIESVFKGKKYLYKKGDSFYESTNGLHAVTRNPDTAKPAKLLVFFIVDKNKETSVREK
jgi:quercetin dioxygenase-like cupin family protein